jgi:hypothetical protein
VEAVVLRQRSIDVAAVERRFEPRVRRLHRRELALADAGAASVP